MSPVETWHVYTLSEYINSKAIKSLYVCCLCDPTPLSESYRLALNISLDSEGESISVSQGVSGQSLTTECCAEYHAIALSSYHVHTTVLCIAGCQLKVVCVYAGRGILCGVGVESNKRRVPASTDWCL